MKILILGSGGRECALAWKISQSPLCTRLFIAPGNGGTRQYGENIQLLPNDFETVAQCCLFNGIELVVVGPEDPLVNGIVDFFRDRPELSHIRVIGPDSRAAMLEGSKSFAKQFMNRYGIPTAAHKSFDRHECNEAKQFLDNFQPPFVIKADGLAAGKGVMICHERIQAEEAIDSILVHNIFKASNPSLVIEEFLDGIEMSAFVLTDGLNYVMLPEAKDYKRIGDHNTGLNTGGMGTVSPVPFADDALKNKIIERIIQPTISGIQKEQMNYCGCIFFGLMIVNENPYVIEYNVRFGDPETQSIMPRIANDLVELFVMAADKKINEAKIEIRPEFVVNVVLASEGYPENYEKGKRIYLPGFNDKGMVFHAGTTFLDAEMLVSSGGRVLSACGTGSNLKEAIDCAYALAETIQFENKYYRKDIGLDLLKYFNV